MGIYIDDPIVPLSQYADDLHAILSEALLADTGIDTEYATKAGLMLATTEEKVGEIRTLYEWLSSHQHDGDVRWLEQDDLRQADPRISPNIPAGLYTEVSHEVEPYRFTLALAQAAELHGATIVNSAVTGITLTDGIVSSVELAGTSIVTRDVVIAMGPWSAEAKEWLGVDIPIKPLKGQIIRLTAPGEPLSISLSWTGNYATTKPDGLLWAGTTEEWADFDETPTSAGRDEVMAELISVLPYLSEARLAQHTACLRPVAPDGLPILGEVGGETGVWAASGTGRKGILLGPGMGRVTADLIVGRTPEVDVSRLGLDRFTE
jgi:glycine oxidase